MEFTKGDAIELEVTANIDITDWKIRAEFFDNNGNSVKLATANSGGSDSQISIDDTSNGVFTLQVPSDETTDFHNNSFLEIEREVNSKKLTIYRNSINMKNQKITWDSPDV